MLAGAAFDGQRLISPGRAGAGIDPAHVFQDVRRTGRALHFGRLAVFEIGHVDCPWLKGAGGREIIPPSCDYTIQTASVVRRVARRTFRPGFERIPPPWRDKCRPPSASRHRPDAHWRSRSTDSAAVTATGTTFWAAAVSGKSRSAAKRQQALTSAPVHWSSLGRCLFGVQLEHPQIDVPDGILLLATGQVQEEYAVEPLCS